MFGDPKFLAGHRADFPHVSARVGVCYSWSMQLTDFLHWLEEAEFRPCRLTPGGHWRDPCVTEICTGIGFLGLMYRVDERPLCLTCGSPLRGLC